MGEGFGRISTFASLSQKNGFVFLNLIWTFKAFIWKLIRFDFFFWQTSKQIYRKHKYTEKVWKEFQRFPRFSRKTVLYSSTKFGILMHWTIIYKLIRFDLGFWLTSKQIYRRLKYKEKVLEVFQRLLCFSRKMILHSSTKFGIWSVELLFPSS